MVAAGVLCAPLDDVSRPVWRAEVAKWQTRYVQGVVGVTPWEFKSPLRHHLQIGWLPELTSILLGNSLKVERLILDQVVGVRIPVPQPNPTQKYGWRVQVPHPEPPDCNAIVGLRIGDRLILAPVRY
jgi:hypothetical protein